MGVRIGALDFINNVFMAPMAGVTDLPFRIICRECGASLAYTEMVSAKALSYGNARTERYLYAEGEPRPRAVQLFGKDAGLLAETAARLKDHDFDIIDINMGCPAPKIIGGGDGSALMREPVLAGEIMAAVVKSAGDYPVTVKIRSGWSNQEKNAPEIAKIAEDSGISAIFLNLSSNTTIRIFKIR